MFARIRIEFGKRPDSGMFADVSDEVKIDCGDYSNERLEALVADTSRKIRKAWGYLEDRESESTTTT